MKIMFSAGEASGDMHGASLARAIKELAPEVELIGMGGTKMAEAGVRIIYDIKNLGFIGVGEIIRKIPFFVKLRTFLVDAMKEEKPDVLVCIDYPGFNMRLIKRQEKRVFLLSIIFCQRFGLGIRAGERRLLKRQILLFLFFLLRHVCMNPWGRMLHM